MTCLRTTPVVRGWTAAVTLFLAANLTACSTDNVTPTGTPTPTAIGMLGGSAQAATVGSALSTPLLLHVTDQYGNGIPGATVTFTATGGAAVANATVTSDASGNAQTTATLGSVAGLNSITATLAGAQVPVTFLESALAGAPAAISIISGNAQTGPNGVALTAPLVVIVKDQSGNAVAGAAVTWTSTAGTLSAPTSVTLADGTAQITFVPALGANGVTATLNGTVLVANFAATGS